MQPELTGILIYPPREFLPPGSIAAAALLAVGAQFPDVPIWIAAHSAKHRSEVEALLKAVGAEAPEAVQRCSIRDAAQGRSIVERLRECFGEEPEARTDASALTDDRGAQRAPDSIGICYGFYALLDSEISRALLADHTRYLAHISYSENVPAGFAPDFVSREFVQALPDPAPAGLAPQDPAGVSGGGDLRAYAFKNIDRFDVEIFYRAPDLRQLRLDLSASDERSVRLVNDLRAHDSGLKFSELEAFIKKHPEVLRPYPSYFEIELSAAFCEDDFRPGTLPEPGAEAAERRAAAGFLSRTTVDKLRNDIAEHGLIRDATVSFAGAGEPCLHPEFLDILKQFLETPTVRQVIVESYGAGLDSALVEKICALAECDRVVFIVRLDSLRPSRYAELYGADRLSNVLEFLNACETTLAAADGEHRRPAIYVEMHRLAETEDELGEFMDRYENPEQNLRPLLRKFNRYIDRLPERRAADLTPLTRDFCWHLARDFFLTVDGRVPLCKQDPYGEAPTTLDFATSSVADFVARTMPHHSASVRGDYESIPMPCLRCDEWYTFNG